MFEAVIDENDNGKFGLSVKGHFAGEFKNPLSAFKELKTLINYEIEKVDKDSSIDVIEVEINDQNEVVVDGVEVDDGVFDDESVDWKLICLEESIDNLISWIAEANRNSADKVLMMQDLKMLMTWDDEYIWSSILTNDYVSPSQNKIKFNEICDKVLSANSAKSESGGY